MAAAEVQKLAVPMVYKMVRSIESGTIKDLSFCHNDEDYSKEQ
jgi:hypothetical protein